MQGKVGKPLGFGLWECWGGFLSLPSGLARDASLWYAEEVLHGVRLMVKFEEWETRPGRISKLVERAELLDSMGLDLHLVIDWWNINDVGPSLYHKTSYIPKDINAAIRGIMGTFNNPGIVEVCNEPYHKKGDKNWLSTHDYRGHVDRYVGALHRTGWDGLLVATQTHNHKNVAKGWEWHIRHNKCAEGRHTAVLHDYTTPLGLAEALFPKEYPRSVGVGWHWPFWETEFSPVGRHTNINSLQGGRLMEAGIKVAKQRKFPLTLLTMGGTNESFGNESWGMHTDLVNTKGKFSDGARVAAAMVGVDTQHYKPGRIDPEPDPAPERPVKPDAGTLPNGQHGVPARVSRSFMRAVGRAMFLREMHPTTDLSKLAKDPLLNRNLRRIMDECGKRNG